LKHSLGKVLFGQRVEIDLQEMEKLELLNLLKTV
jgi:hypothetical protein